MVDFTFLKNNPKRWLVTGAAGFIGSNLVEELLKLNQEVVGLDNFANGSRANLEDIQKQVSPEHWSRFKFIEGDICDLETCQEVCQGVDVISHQAALGSIPRSLKDPLRTHIVNVDGFLNMMIAARDQGIKRFVYASSSSVYGDHPDLPKVEDKIGRQLSPYAVSKRADEMYAAVFAQHFGLELIGLRYFNVFGPRQNPAGPYAAVIPKWIDACLHSRPVEIFGDGETSRDFCFVANAVQINILAATTAVPEALNQIYNVAVGQRTTLNQIIEIIQGNLRELMPDYKPIPVSYRDFRPGDIRHSLAAIDKAQSLLVYDPQVTVREGLRRVIPQYMNRARGQLADGQLAGKR